MAKIDTIQLSNNNFVNVGVENIIGLIVVNTHTDDISFDLMLGEPTLSGGTDTTNAIHILKSVPVPVGSTFTWDDDNVLSGVFEAGSSITLFNANTGKFEVKKGLTFLLRLDTDSTAASVVLRRQ
tara:strand:+ start:121 stop:495 length:375 start_codon:yes stop_codon:yes gene_type:complete